MEAKLNTDHKILEQVGYNLHYFVSGNIKGETIVFLHPAFADHRCFNKQLEALGKKYLVITLDMLGHGLSQPSKTNDKIDKTAEQVKQFLAIEGISQAHLVGVSMGSLIAQFVAIQYPEMVLSLTVLGGYDISADNKEVNKAQRKEGLKWIFKILFSMESFQKYLASITVSNSDSQVEMYEMVKCFTRKSFMYMAGMKNVIKRRENPKMECPLLILVGDNDLELAQRMAKKFHESIPSSQFYTIPNAGHCANMDNAKVFNELLGGFLIANKSV